MRRCARRSAKREKSFCGKKKEDTSRKCFKKNIVDCIQKQREENIKGTLINSYGSF
jgi:hypothetical protein